MCPFFRLRALPTLENVIRSLDATESSAKSNTSTGLDLSGDSSPCDVSGRPMRLQDTNSWHPGKCGLSPLLHHERRRPLHSELYRLHDTRPNPVTRSDVVSVWQNGPMDTNFSLLQVADIPPGTLLLDRVDPESGLRVLVIRSHFSFCGYAGVKTDDHTLSRLNEVEFPCHGGITFRQWGADGTPWEPGWYWWGWDYGHYMDVVNYGLPPEMHEQLEKLALLRSEQTDLDPLKPKDWTVAEVCEDCLATLGDILSALKQDPDLAGLVVPR